MSKTQAKSARMVNDEIAVQILDALKEKTVHYQKQEMKIMEKFQAITWDNDEAHRG
jgi:hypothetical protein